MTDDNGQPYNPDEYKLEVSPVGVVLVRKDAAATKTKGGSDKPSTESKKS